MAIASLILGILALLSSAAPFAGIGLGIVAIILGILGRKKLAAEGRKTGAAVAGIVLGALGLAGNAAVTVFCVACSAAVANAEPSTATSSLLDQAAAAAAAPGATATPAAGGRVLRCDLSNQPGRMCSEYHDLDATGETAARETCSMGQIGVPEGSRIGLTEGTCPTDNAIARCTPSFGGTIRVYYRDPDPSIDNDAAMSAMETLCIGTFTRL